MYNFKEPTSEDFRKYERYIEHERQQAKKEARELQRVAVLRNVRSTRPPNYAAPKTAKELQARITGGESYFAETVIVGEEIDFPLDHLNFESSIFRNCKFGNKCSLKEVTFKQSRLADCSLADGVSVSGADFENAKIERVVGLFLDENNIRGTTFGGERHAWLVLKSAYGAHWQIYHVLFGFAYFLPLLGKIIFLSALASAQSKIEPHVWREHHFVERSVPSLVFSESGILWYLALLVLAYQALRAFVSYRMTPLIAWETETGFAPNYKSYFTYYKLHLLVVALSFSSIIAFFVQLWFLMNGSIYVPSSLIPSPH